MNREIYDMPLQNIVRRKLASPSLTHNQLSKSPINTVQKDDQFLFTEISERNYDLPCQRVGDQYLFTSYVENRPVAMKNYYHEASKYTMDTRSNQAEIQKRTITENTTNQNVRSRITSIYQRLLQENKHKNKQNDYILTQATFKPKQLQSQLNKFIRHQSAEHLRNKEIKPMSGNKAKQHSNHKKFAQHSKKLDYVVNTNARTKYEQILKQHFHPGYFSKKKQEYKSPQDVRLSKICGKNSAILKLKERLQPVVMNFTSIKNKDFDKIGERQSTKQMTKDSIKTESKNQFKKSFINQKVIEKKSNISPQKSQVNRQQKHESDRQSKNMPSERWMSMNFYERQQRVLSNRKQKQLIGKQKNMQKQIKPCTFKPQLITKSKSVKTIATEKQSYLQQYYNRLYRKY